jgi:CelD/BcsL family acetyltransferase involved in cellulose biosynthesis
MRILTFDDLDARSDAYDAVVDASPLPDRFCSTSDWLIPAVGAFSDEAEPTILAFDEGWAPLMTARTVLGRTWMPLEASWGLAAPLVGPAPARLATRFVEAALELRDGWDALFLSGLQRGGPAYQVLVSRLGRRFRLGLGQPTARCVASLEGGMDGFLARRSGHFRKNLRRARRDAGPIAFEVLRPTPAEVPAALEAVLDVERRSWKGREGHGIDQGPMLAFYRAMAPRLAARGGLRITIARLEGRPVGYVLGGVRGGGYRGLQISFDQDLSDRSLGNLLQLATVEALCAEAVASYDLGTDMPYKRHWAEQLVETVPLVVR